MSMIVSAVPVMFLHPFNGRVDMMPVEMIGAYFPNGTDLRLEEAAKVACIRDTEAGVNLLASFTDQPLATTDTEYLSPEGCNYDESSVEPPSLR